MNSASSRSHLCLTISLSINEEQEKTESKLHIIDLAGSEMVRKTDATGLRFQESKHINRSLSALGNVIAALSPPPTLGQTPSPPVHVPYRDSKLTRLLQNSLGGNANSAILLAVSPCVHHLVETLSTLKFGERARRIQIQPYRGRLPPASDQRLAAATAEIQRLKKLVAAMEERTSFEEVRCLQCRQQVDNTAHYLEGDNTTHYLEVDNTKHYLEVDNTTHYLEVDSNKGGVSPEPPITDSHSFPVPPAVLEDTDPRCGVCGMSSDDSDRLMMMTGETLGQLFSCDGNCGMKFHPVCVGVIGGGGQFCSPEGEWFCLQCRTPFEEVQMLIRQERTPFEEVQVPSDPLLQYHWMRRERNRLLQSWQTDKQLFLSAEKRWRAEQERHDIDLIGLKQKHQIALQELEEKKVENRRLREIYEEAVIQFQQKQDLLHSSDRNLSLTNGQLQSKWKSLEIDMDHSTINNDNGNINGEEDIPRPWRRKPPSVIDVHQPMPSTNIPFPEDKPIVVLDPKPLLSSSSPERDVVRKGGGKRSCIVEERLDNDHSKFINPLKVKGNRIYSTIVIRIIKCVYLMHVYNVTT